MNLLAEMQAAVGIAPTATDKSDQEPTEVDILLAEMQAHVGIRPTP